MAHMMLEAKRATRGKRMNSLVGQAAEDDDAFWGHDVWQEGGGSDEESFHTQDEEEKPDEFDSDFNDSETEDEEDEDEEEEKAAQRGGKVQSKTANRYKDPAMLKKKQPKGIKNPFASSENDNDAAMDVDESADDQEETASKNESRKEQQKATAKERKRVTYDVLPRSVRESTKSKTQSADIARAKKDTEDRKKKRTNLPKPTKCQFNYQDLLQEALHTEDENRKWLEMRKFWLQHKEEQDKKLNNPLDTVVKDYVRYYSRRNVGTYVTFSSQDAVPKCLREESNHAPSPPPSNICVITGLPAKYRDPKTLLPYANAAALRELRRRNENGRLPIRSPHTANSNYRNNGSSTVQDLGSAQKTVRVVVQPKEEKTEPMNSVDIASSAVSLETVNPTLSLPRSLSHTSLRAAGNLSQQTTPRHGPLSNLSPSNPTLPVASPTSPQTPKGYLRPSKLNLEDSLEKAADEADIAEVMKSGKPHRQGNNFIYVAPSIRDASLSAFQTMLPPGLTVDSSNGSNDQLQNEEDFPDEMFLGRDIAAIVRDNMAKMRKEEEALILCIK